MTVSAVAVGLIALLPAGTAGGGGARLAHLSPVTLAQRDAVRVADSSLGLAWARRGQTLVYVAKPRATGSPIHVVDARTFARRHVIAVGDRDVCGLTFDGGELVALTADRPCYWSGGRFALMRFDTRSWRATRTIALPGLHTVYPTNLAFGDGSAFVAYAGAGLDAIDLRTGAVTRHHPRRSLAKGEGIVWTRWLGRHQLGVGPAVVDVRTWRSRVFDPTALGVSTSGADLVVYGPHGAEIFTRSGHLRLRLLAGTSLGVVRVVGNYLYAGERNTLTAHVIDLRTRQELDTTADANLIWTLLVP